MKKILFIEDEPALQKTLGDFLKTHGYEVRSALEGKEGLELLKREPPELLLLDLVLPGMHGLDILKAMRADQALAAIPVIVLTNVETSEAVEEAVQLGAKAYLVKTNYSLNEVLEKIKAVTGG